MTTPSRVNRILRAGINAAKTPQGRSQVNNVSISQGYAEPGYDNQPSGIVALGNWNTVTRFNSAIGRCDEIDDAPSRVAKLLERIGVALEWEDEWAVCDGCLKVVRTEPDCFCWQPSYVQTNGGFFCKTCSKD